MTFRKSAEIICLAWVSVLCVGNLAQDWSIAPIPSLVSSAQARVGRPLTPVSVVAL